MGFNSPGALTLKIKRGNKELTDGVYIGEQLTLEMGSLTGKIDIMFGHNTLQKDVKQTGPYINILMVLSVYVFIMFYQFGKKYWLYNVQKFLSMLYSIKYVFINVSVFL